jgi:hypothetical protein
MAKYLYIYEDELSQYDSLNRDDADAIEEGDLIVVIWEDGKFYRLNSEGNKFEIESDGSD